MMIYRKEYMKELNSFKDNKIIKVVTSIPRSDKSTLLNMFSDELLADWVKKEQIQFINFELMKYDSIRNYKDLYNLVVSNILTNQKITYFWRNSASSRVGKSNKFNFYRIRCWYLYNRFKRISSFFRTIHLDLW